MIDNPDDLSQLPLGQVSEYITTYTPSLLHPIRRADSRQGLGIEGDELPFAGIDLWTAYELSWLDAQGMPVVAVGEFSIPCNSPNIIESKSLKLYLNSFNQTTFNDFNEVARTLESDLSSVAGTAVIVQVAPLKQVIHRGLGHFTGESLDHLRVEVGEYQPNPDLLVVDQADHFVHEALYSDLLKTNCPVTGQPDWASIYINYAGAPINREGLLRYIISYREHQDFHEHCVESIFTDILKRCEPKELTVYARYTRRGGLDINPFRTNCGEEPLDVRLVRQ